MLPSWQGSADRAWCAVPAFAEQGGAGLSCLGSRTGGQPSGRRLRAAGRKDRVRSWPVHTIQSGLARTKGTVLGWCRTSVAESMHAVYPTRAPENVAGCQAGPFRLRGFRFGPACGNGPLAMVVSTTNQKPARVLCRGAIGGFGSTATRPEAGPVPGTSSFAVRRVPWLPMHTPSREQLRRSSRDGHCREPGSRTGPIPESVSSAGAAV